MTKHSNSKTIVRKLNFKIITPTIKLQLLKLKVKTLRQVLDIIDIKNGGFLC